MQEVSTEVIRRQLEVILESSDFSASNRFRQFLKFVVEETLAGREKELKAYTIATQVFGRDKNFDPLLDPVVRVEAAKLRNKLEQFYLRRKGQGKDDVYIAIPKGSYVPVFERMVESMSKTTNLASPELAEEIPVCVSVTDSGQNESLVKESEMLIETAEETVNYIGKTEPAPSVDNESRQRGAELSVVILPFSNISSSGEIDHLLSGLAEELAIALTKFEDLKVISAHAISADHAANPDQSALASSLGARFAVSGSAQLDANILRVRVKLVDIIMHTTLWAEKFDEPYTATGLFEIIDTTATQVAAQIGDSFGYIKRTLFREIPSQRTGSIKAFEGILYYHHWAANLSEGRLINAKEALDKAVEADPRYCLAYAMLADIYAVHHQWAYDLFPNDLETARKLARRAIELDAHCQYAQWSNAYVCYLSRDKDQFMHLARLAVSLNPADTNIIAAAGQKLAMCGNWEEGLELIRKAEQLNPFLPSWFHTATFTYCLHKGSLEGALQEAKRILAPRIAGPLFSAAVLGVMGHKEKAAAEVQEVLSIAPDFSDRYKELLNRIFFQDSIIKLLTEGLENAGL